MTDAMISQNIDFSPGIPVHSSVCTAMGYRLDDRGSVPGRRQKYFSLLHIVQPGSGTHPGSYRIDIGVSFPRGKTAVA
jgi:hypothetical protein